MIQSNQQMYQSKPSQTQIGLLGDKRYFEISSNRLLAGFIYHPPSYPLSYKRVWFSRKRREEQNNDQQAIGLCFKSQKDIKLGITIKILIPIKNKTQHLRGQVILVRKLDNYSEIGVWLTTTTDVHRARAIEQICHIEAYLQAKKYQHGPSINHNRIKQEWIDKYAASFPAVTSKWNGTNRDNVN